MKKRFTFNFALLIVIFSALLLVIFALLAGMQQQIKAQSPEMGGFYGLVISPVKEEYFIERGKTASASFDIRHDFSDPEVVIKLFPFINDFTSDNKTGIPHLLDPSRPKDVTTLEDWVTLDKEEFSLDFRGAKVTINYTISVPEDANFGSYYAAVILSDTKDIKERFDENQVSLTFRIGYLLLVTVPGDIVSNLDIIDLKLTDYQGITPFFNIFEFQPVNIVTTLGNNGNVYLIPGGDVFIHQGDITKSLFSAPFNENSAAVLSGSYREFTVSWNDGFARFDEVINPSNGESTQQFTLHPENLSKFYLGKYQVSVKVLFQVNPDGEFKIIEKNAEFLIIPWKLILLLLVLIITYFLWRRHRKKRLLKKETL